MTAIRHRTAALLVQSAMCLNEAILSCYEDNVQAASATNGAQIRVTAEMYNELRSKFESNNPYWQYDPKADELRIYGIRVVPGA